MTWVDSQEKEVEMDADTFDSCEKYAVETIDREVQEK